MDLGAGGAGPTFLVETESGDRAVVKSMWDPVSSVDPRPGLRPLALLHKQGVPGLAQLLHLGVNLDEYPYITTAFVEGDDFESVLEARGGQVPHMQVCMLGSLAASRLSAIHEVGSVHGNVKPGNMIMGVGEEGLEVTLLDPCIPNVLLAAPGRLLGHALGDLGTPRGASGTFPGRFRAVFWDVFRNGFRDVFQDVFRDVFREVFPFFL